MIIRRAADSFEKKDFLLSETSKRNRAPWLVHIHKEPTEVERWYAENYINPEVMIMLFQHVNGVSYFEAQIGFLLSDSVERWLKDGKDMNSFYKTIRWID